MSDESLPSTIRLLLEARADLSVENWMNVNFIAGHPEGEVLEVALAQANLEIETYLREHPEAGHS